MAIFLSEKIEARSGFDFLDVESCGARNTWLTTGDNGARSPWRTVRTVLGYTLDNLSLMALTISTGFVV